MSNDGATYGITAEQALGGVLGGADIPEEAKQTREQVRARLDVAPRLADIYVRTEHVVESTPDSDLTYEGDSDVLYAHGKKLNIDYGGCADVVARAILDFIETHPQHAEAPGENEYAKDAWAGYNSGEDLERLGPPKALRRGMYDLMKEAGYDLGKLGITGFQWGFAYNLARWLRYEEGEGNPAIIEVSA